MRLAIVSDIHGNLKALEAVVRDIERRSVDAVMNLGDSLSGPLMPKGLLKFDNSPQENEISRTRKHNLNKTNRL